MQEKEGSDILKLAVMAHNTGDALRLMSATWKVRNYYSGKPMLTMAMGRWGVLSRATGEFTGSDLTFAMVGGIPSAPGQIPYKDVKKVMDILHDAMYPKGA
jgi:3-dehydroquinate dehydratase